MIRLSKEDEIWIVTLDRAEKANSLTRSMLVEICEIAENAHSAKGVILTGTGKTFSAGADLEEAKAGLAVDPIWERLSSAVAGLECLTIAALNGTLAGGAFGMALACDIRLSVPSAKFFYPVMKLGFLPQPSDPKRLVDLVGPARAKLILMAGAKIDAQEAMNFGLIERICDDPLAEALCLCEAPQAAKKTHISAIKAMSNA